MRRAVRIALLATWGVATAWAGGGRAAGAQEAGGRRVEVRDLVVTAGATGTRYWGDFSSVTVLQIDSTRSALAGNGEFGARGSVVASDPNRELRLDFDAGLAQFATGGFELRNYAPREYRGKLVLYYAQYLGDGGGVLEAKAEAEARGVADRPPMPLYMQPGQRRWSGSVGYWRPVASTDLIDHVEFAFTVENRDFAAPRLLPQLDLLDRSSGELTARTSRSWLGASGGADTLRVFGAYRYHSYPRKGLSIRRKDRAVRLGVEWVLDRHETPLGFRMAVGVNGTLNRSNSRRVEYNSIHFGGLAAKRMGAKTVAILETTLSAKSYTHQGRYQYLVPGEEADNATIVHAKVRRELGLDVHGVLGVFWRDIETNISGAFYRSLGTSFTMNIRPRL